MNLIQFLQYPCTDIGTKVLRMFNFQRSTVVTTSQRAASQHCRVVVNTTTTQHNARSRKGRSDSATAQLFAASWGSNSCVAALRITGCAVLAVVL